LEKLSSDIRDAMAISSDRPLVSVVIPVYNGSDFLKTAIESALNQSYDNIEIVVVNDGSTDNGQTQSIIDSYNGRIIGLKKENGGVASALNEGIKKASGSFVAWLSHDDIFVREKIEIQIGEINRLNNCGIRNAILYGDYLEVDENSIPLTEHRLPDIPPSKFYQALLGGYVFRSILYPVPFSFHGCTTLIPRQAFLDLGFFKTNLRTTQDYDAWFRFICGYQFLHIPEIMVISRTHSRQGSKIMKEIMSEEVNQLYFSALDYYKTSINHNLELGKIAFALSLDPRRKLAHQKIKEIIKNEGVGIKESHYYYAATIWNKRMVKPYWLIANSINNVFNK